MLSPGGVGLDGFFGGFPVVELLPVGIVLLLEGMQEPVPHLLKVLGACFFVGVRLCC